jgi:cyclohexanecarboxyl-CoA dehydrogenase
VRLSEDDRLLASTMRRYAMTRLLPDAPRWRDEPYPRDHIRALGELGVLGVRVDPEHGGSGGTFVALGVACEELGRGDFNVCYFPQLAAIAAELLRGAEPAVQRRWLPAVAGGEAVVAFGLTEPGVGSDAANLALRARREGDELVLSGEKSSITFAGFADACVVFARTGGPGARGISAVMVPLDRPGVSRRVYPSTCSTLTQRGSLLFEEVRVPADHQIGPEGTGFVHAMTALDFNRALIGLASVGAAEQSLDETIAYVKERHTFGQPLARREGVAFELAEHLTMVRAARHLAYETLELADAGENHTQVAAMAKWLGPKCAVEAIHASMILHGWIGYSAEMPFDQRMRDVSGLEVGDGTPHIMKAVIAREAMGREFTSYR